MKRIDAFCQKIRWKLKISKFKALCLEFCWLFVVSNYTLAISSKEIPNDLKVLINTSKYLKLKDIHSSTLLKK